MKLGTKLFCAFILLLAGGINVCIYVLTHNDPYIQHDGVVPMIAGTADRPFVNRPLLPTVARVLSREHVDPTERTEPLGGKPRVSLTPQSRDPKGVMMVMVRGWGLDPVHYKPVRILLYLMGLAYGVFGMAMLALIRRFTPWTLDRALLLALLSMSVPSIMSIYEPHQVYDPGTLAFAGFLTYLALTRQQAAFLALLAIALFAKESLAVLSVLLLLPAYEARDWRRFATIVGVVALEYAVVQKLIVAHFYGHNPGATFELTYRGQYDFMDNLRMVTFTSFFGQRAWVRLSVVVIPLVIALRRSSRGTGRMVLVLTAFHAAPLFVVGRFEETRIFYELLPVWCLVAAPSILQWLGVETEPVEIAVPSPRLVATPA